MYIILFKREDLDVFLMLTSSSRLDVTGLHSNIIKILNCFPDAKDKFNQHGFNEKLKHYLRNYRLIVIDDLNTINKLDYILAIEISDHFPYESVLDKKNIARDREAIIVYKDAIWHLVEQIQMQMNQTQSPSTHNENADDNNDDVSGIGSTIRNWFGHCSSYFYHSPTRDGYRSVELQEAGLNAGPRGQINGFNFK